MASCCNPNGSSCKEFRDVFKIFNTDKYSSAVASSPYEVCFCDDGKHQPNCSYRATSTTVFPGQDFTLRLAVVGYGYDTLGPKLDGVVPGAIRAYFESSYNANLGLPKSSQINDQPYCRDFNYSVNTTERNVMFRLIPEQMFFKTITAVNSSLLTLSVTVHFKDCPPGFIFSNVTSNCVCDPVLSIENIMCFINDQSILCPAKNWIGFVNVSAASSKPCVVFHPNCPIGYCMFAI